MAEKPSASVLAKLRIAARGVASLFRPAPAPIAVHDIGPADVVSPDTLREGRIPPGQVRAKRWPVLHAGATPRTDLARWTFSLTGLVERPVSWSWPEFQALPASRVFADMHCVTRWSLLDNTWEGVLVSELLKRVTLAAEARFVLVRSDGGYTTNLTLDEFRAEDCLLAWSHNGRALEPDHGGPLRLIVPRLYAWKSAKWIRGVEFLQEDAQGFWEENGYHNHGDPWAENAKGTDSVERYG